jgi:hypothetical protein
MPEENADTQKPVGPFDDFEGCVRHFEDDEQVDDPEALCGWMEENSEAAAVQEYQPDEDEVQALVEAMKEPAADTVLTDLQVTHVSGVGDPAQDSQWVMAKDASDQDADWGVNAPLLFKSTSPLGKPQHPGADHGEDEDDEQEDEGEDEDAEDEQKKAWAPVLIPNETDKQGDVIPPEAIEKAAHLFLAEFRNIDTDHDLLEGKGVPIESWTLKEESAFTLPDGSESRPYPKGTWMLGVKFTDETWQRVKEGDLNGFSIYGEATEHSVQELLGGGVDVAMGSTIAEFQATAKEADSSTTETMTDPEDNPENEGNEQEAKDGEGGEQPDEGGEDQPTLKEIQDTVESTNESVESMQEKQADHAERLESLESEVFEKDEGTEGEGDGEQEGESEKDQPEVDADEVAEQAAEEASEKATEAATEAAEEQVKSLLGLDEDEDLPEDPQERQEVVRKHLHESPEDDGLGSPDSWSEDEVSEVVK